MRSSYICNRPNGHSFIFFFFSVPEFHVEEQYLLYTIRPLWWISLCVMSSETATATPSHYTHSDIRLFVRQLAGNFTTDMNRILLL